MPSVKKFITKKYLAAKNADEYNHQKFIIDSVFVESVGQEGQEKEKLCIRFKGIEQPLVLNQTNLSVLSLAYGDNTDEWVNNKVMLNIVNVTFNGEVTKGIQLEPISK